MTPTILCADDDAQVRSVTKIALERGGYRVIMVSTGQEAISIFERDPSRIALVLLDWRMPDLDCAVVVARLRMIRPDVRIVLTSGFGRSTALAGPMERQVNGFLAKPYFPKDLVQAVTRALKRQTRAIEPAA